ncbi:MAG: 50S ribosomal protein L17 [Deltaproteobacteria bacterium]|jgi:large subunit ribosomal protein L17|nr:50S ribosomal protein L17 [Deltaproteobacteria bacterium]
MRHRKSNVKLGRTASHRDAMLRNMATSMFRHEQLQTTVAKGKALKPLVDKLVTLAKKGDLEARRRIHSILRNETVAKQLIETAKDRFSNRESGYTIVVKNGHRRGDRAPMILLRLCTLADVKVIPGSGSAGIKVKTDRGRRVAASRAATTGRPAATPAATMDLTKRAAEAPLAVVPLDMAPPTEDPIAEAPLTEAPLAEAPLAEASPEAAPGEAPEATAEPSDDEK